MKKIKFSHNWNNKLSAKIFTTIRKATQNKVDYYKGCVGEDFQVLLNNKKICEARLINVGITMFKKIPPILLMLDTGTKDYKKIFKRFGIYDNTYVIHLELEVTK
jgi:hypothetical protein